MSTRKTSLLLTCVSAVLLASCSGATKAPEEPASPTSSTESAPPTGTDSETADGEAMSEEELAALAEIEQGEGAAPDAGAPEAGREVVYRMTPDGLKVEVEGAVFTPSAKSYKTPEGYGVEITVEATAKIEALLANPEAGPLAFGGRVIRKTGRIDTFGDKRSGSGTRPLGPQTPQKFSRKWPIANVSLLSPGDELELEVGLWGYGPKDGAVRPVRKFASVKMKASDNGASPVIDAPGQ